MINSQWAMVINAFSKRKGAVWCLRILLCFYALAILAPWVAPYRFDDENRMMSYCPPTPIEVHDGKSIVMPFVYGRHFTFDENHRRIYVVDPTQKYPLQFFKNGKLISVESPGRLYILGADSRGRDLLSRIIYGARISLSIGLLGVFISFSLGLIIGGIAGYFGGWMDAMLMRVCEMFMLIPGFYLLLALRSAVPENFSSLQVYIMIVVILALLGWASLARVIRGMALSLKGRDYVAAAKLLGVPDIVIIIRHILPHTISYSLVAMMLAIPSYILSESGLSLIGLGIQDPIPSWGNLLSDAMAIVPIAFAPWILIPGLIIFITIVCFNVVGDALRDALDPMMIKEVK